MQGLSMMHHLYSQVRNTVSHCACDCLSISKLRPCQGVDCCLLAATLSTCCVYKSVLKGLPELLLALLATIQNSTV